MVIDRPVSGKGPDVTDEQLPGEQASHLIERLSNSPMTRRELLVRASTVGLSATAIGGALAACGGRSAAIAGAGGSSGAPKYGGTYNYPLDGEPVGIAPNTYQESIGYNVVRQVFEGLMKYQVASDGVTMNTVPSLCTGYDGEPRR